MFQEIQYQCDLLASRFHHIPEGRKAVLAKLGTYIQQKKDHKQPVHLVYICTHNSRRSHLGQVWAAVAAAYYHVPNVHTYSGGTETTALHPNVIRALQTTGFEVSLQGNTSNPVYHIYFGDGQFCSCFSKVYDDPVNPHEQFAAIMTCSDADENCPFIPGAEQRIPTTYEDPKVTDDTPLEAQTYLDRSNQIALETLYAFSLVH